jgi:hypothetical protein
MNTWSLEKRREYARNWKKAHPGYFKAKQKAILQTPEGREKYNTYQREYRKKDGFKVNARSIVFIAVRNKTLIPLPCEKCRKKAHAHHDDYSKPLEVRWLCIKHHKEEHARL